METRLTAVTHLAKEVDGDLVGAQRAAPLQTFDSPVPSGATPFHTPEYLVCYRRFFGTGKTFHRIKTPCGGAWLQSRGKSARRLEWWGAGIHDIGGPVCDSLESVSDLWRRIEALAQHNAGAHLAQIPADSEIIELAKSAKWHISDAEKCPVLSLPPTWEEYLKQLGKNMREQIKRYPKRLDKEFRTEYSLATTPAEVTVALDDLFRLHSARWRARGQTGVLATPRRQKFHRALCEKFLKRDWLRLWTLRCNGDAVCVLLNYAYKGRYYFFIGGFDPEYSRWSVGTCLFSKVFQLAIEEDAYEFDFLKGEEEYKYRFGAKNRDYKTLSWFAPTARGRLLQRRVRFKEQLMHKLHKKFSSAHRKGSG